MMIDLRIICTHPEVLEVWRGTFRDMERTQFRSASLGNARADERFVCLLMPATIVYDRLGQRPSVGRSEVFDAKSIPRLRMDGFNYIATTVPFPGRVKFFPAETGASRWHFEPVKQMTRKEEFEKLFGSMLTAVDEFNSTFDDVITGLVIDLDVVNSKQNSAIEDASGAVRAVRHHRTISDFSDRLSVLSDQDLSVASPLAAFVSSNRPQGRSRFSPIEPVRQFYLTTSAIRDAEQLSLTRGEVIDAALSGELIDRSRMGFPFSDKITILSQLYSSGELIEIRGVIDTKRQRLTIQALKVRKI